MICQPCKDECHDCCHEYAHKRKGSCDCQHRGYEFDEDAFPEGWAIEDPLLKRRLQGEGYIR